MTRSLKIAWLEWWSMWPVLLAPAVVYILAFLWVMNHLWHQGWPLAGYFIATLAAFGATQMLLTRWYVDWSSRRLQQLYGAQEGDPANTPVGHHRPPGRLLKAAGLAVVAYLLVTRMSGSDR